MVSTWSSFSLWVVPLHLEHDAFVAYLRTMYEVNKYVKAICAAPMVLGRQVFNGHALLRPGVLNEAEFEGSDISHLVGVDDRL